MDVSQNTYSVVAHLPNGTDAVLDSAVTGLSYGHERGEVAQRATIAFARVLTSNGQYMNEVLALCTRLSIIANGVEVMRGIVWESDYDASNSGVVTVMVYDSFIYAQQSKDNFYFKKGKSTKAVVEAICEKWEIPVVYEWVEHKNKKLMYRGNAIADAITQTLERTRLEEGVRYVCLMEGETLHIKRRGTNEDIYVFGSAEGNVSGLTYAASLSGLITRVIVTGKESRGKIPVKATLNGRIDEFGIIQDIQDKGSLSLAKAKQEAQYLLDEHGDPEETIRISAPDVPTIRKGDKVKCAAGPLNGFYIVLAVSHDAMARTMEMEVEKVKSGE